MSKTFIIKKIFDFFDTKKYENWSNRERLKNKVKFVDVMIRRLIILIVAFLKINVIFANIIKKIIVTFTMKIVETRKFMREAIEQYNEKREIIDWSINNQFESQHDLLNLTITISSNSKILKKYDKKFF